MLEPKSAARPGRRAGACRRRPSARSKEWRVQPGANPPRVGPSPLAGRELCALGNRAGDGARQSAGDSRFRRPCKTRPQDCEPRRWFRSAFGPGRGPCRAQPQARQDCGIRGRSGRPSRRRGCNRSGARRCGSHYPTRCRRLRLALHPVSRRTLRPRHHGDGGRVGADQGDARRIELAALCTRSQPAMRLRHHSDGTSHPHLSLVPSRLGGVRKHPHHCTKVQLSLLRTFWQCTNGGSTSAVGEEGHSMGSMKKNKRILRRGAMAVAGVAVLLVCCAASNDAISNAEKADKHRPGMAETKAIAEEGFIYGLPIVMNYAVMYEYAVDRDSGQFKAPFNQIKNEARVFTYKDTAIITPNSDTPYSLLWMDLRAEPMVLSVPNVEKSRYYSVMLCDGNTFNYGYIGSRATGSDAGDYLVVGPSWQGITPPGIQKVFQSSTQFSLAAYRTQLLNPADMPNVVKVQAGYKGQPLSAYLKQTAPPAAPPIDFPKIDKEMVKKNFFEYLDFALQFAPAGPEERIIREKLERIGVGPGKTFAFKDLPLEHKLEIGLGMKDGDEKVEKYLSGAKSINGWTITSLFGDRLFFSGDWLKRAAAAKGGIYGNNAVEAVYPLAKTLANGEVLDGSKHNYTLTFAAGEYPPVDAFWSVTMYDGKTQLLIENPINRYLINSPMLPSLKKNPDGSLTFYIQKGAPSADKKSNWLPAPNDTVYLVMRLYWPKETPPSILPAGEGNVAATGCRGGFVAYQRV